MKFIEVEDCMGHEALIDPFSVITVEQVIEEDNKLTVVYFNNFHIELNESYESVKNKLNESLSYYYFLNK